MISSVTWQEVLYGMFLLPAGKRRHRIEDYLFRRILPALLIVGFEERAAHGRLNSALAPSSGQISFPPGFPDRSDHCRERFGAGHS